MAPHPQIVGSVAIDAITELKDLMQLGVRAGMSIDVATCRRQVRTLEEIELCVKAMFRALEIFAQEQADQDEAVERGLALTGHVPVHLDLARHGNVVQFPGPAPRPAFSDGYEGGAA